MFLFEIGTIGVIAVLAFFFIALGSGVFAFIMLRKTIKMALRMVVVAVILLIAVFGSIALWLFLQPSHTSRPTPTSNRPAANRTR